MTRLCAGGVAAASWPKKGWALRMRVGLEVEEGLVLLLDPSGEAPQFVTLGTPLGAQRWRGFNRLWWLILVSQQSANCSWDNPFYAALKGYEIQWNDDEIGIAGCIISLVAAVRDNTEPTYGPTQGRLDQELVLAMRKSSRLGGQPSLCRLPSWNNNMLKEGFRRL